MQLKVKTTVNQRPVNQIVGVSNVTNKVCNQSDQRVIDNQDILRHEDFLSRKNSFNL